MDWYGPLANGEHDLGRTTSSTVVVTSAGTGTGVLGYKDKDGVFAAYTNAAATLAGDDEAAAEVGFATHLMISVTGAGADYVVGVGKGGV